MRDLRRLPAITPELLLGATPLPRASTPLRFSLGNVSAHNRPQVLQECFARLGFTYEVEPLSDATVEADVVLHSWPGLKMAAGRMHGSRNRRTRALTADADDLGLLVNLRGPHLVAQGKHELELGDGDAAFLSCTDPSSLTHRPPGDVLIFRFPRARFVPLVNHVEDRLMQPISGDTQALKLLTNYADLLWSDRATVSPELQQLVVGHVYDLMAFMMGATRDAADAAQGRGIRAARLHAIKQDIDKNLNQPDLSVAMVAQRHACTPRFVQRLFEAEGTTFTEYLLAQRLERAHRLLSDPRRDGEKISSVAYDSGFGDVSYFNRVFRRHYGAAPSDIRAQARRPAPALLA
jgi:AraC-like DNA-binding protein